MKKILFGLFITLILGNLKVVAFDYNSINIVDTEIYFPSIVYLNETNTISVDNDVLNSQSKVYSLIIELTESQYNNLKSKHDEISQLSSQYEADLDAFHEQVEELYQTAQEALETYNNDPTEENEALFNEAKANYDTKLDEYNNKVEELNSSLKQKENEFYEIVPLDESKFNEINKSEENTLSFSTKYDYYYGSYQYGLVWVKVSTGEDNYYNFAVVTPEILKDDSKDETDNKVEETSTPSNDSVKSDDVDVPNTASTYSIILIISGVLLAVSGLIIFIGTKKKMNEV